MENGVEKPLENTPLNPRRVHRRLSVTEDFHPVATVRLDGAVVFGRVVDYSVSGAQVALDEGVPDALRPGAEVTMGIKPSRRSYFRIQGQIRWVTQRKIGIHFEPEPALAVVLTLMANGV